MLGRCSVFANGADERLGMLEKSVERLEIASRIPIVDPFRGFLGIEIAFGVT